MHGRLEGNYLRRSKRMFHLSSACDQLIAELSLYHGVNRSAVVEFAIRRFYRLSHGSWPIIDDHGIYRPEWIQARRSPTGATSDK